MIDRIVRKLVIALGVGVLALGACSDGGDGGAPAGGTGGAVRVAQAASEAQQA